MNLCQTTYRRALYTKYQGFNFKGVAQGLEISKTNKFTTFPEAVIVIREITKLRALSLQMWLLNLRKIYPVLVELLHCKQL